MSDSMAAIISKAFESGYSAAMEDLRIIHELVTHFQQNLNGLNSAATFLSSPPSCLKSA